MNVDVDDVGPWALLGGAALLGVVALAVAGGGMCGRLNALDGEEEQGLRFGSRARRSSF